MKIFETTNRQAAIAHYKLNACAIFRPIFDDKNSRIATRYLVFKYPSQAIGHWSSEVIGG